MWRCLRLPSLHLMLWGATSATSDGYMYNQPSIPKSYLDFENSIVRGVSGARKHIQAYWPATSLTWVNVRFLWKLSGHQSGQPCADPQHAPFLGQLCLWWNWKSPQCALPYLHVKSTFPLTLNFSYNHCSKWVLYCHNVYHHTKAVVLELLQSLG